MILGTAPVKVTLDVSSFWPDGVTIEVAAKELGMNPRSITTMRKGTERGNWETLVRLSRWLTHRTGQQISIDDLLVIEDDDYNPGQEVNHNEQS
ncbi:MAG: hypothetical protein F6J95_023525 [Leptolyngbya sp. SIO1E4]|nr:hypothetical protein [Leptolyngbya sp. SIO1E4]